MKTIFTEPLNELKDYLCLERALRGAEIILSIDSTYCYVKGNYTVAEVSENWRK